MDESPVDESRTEKQSEEEALRTYTANSWGKFTEGLKKLPLNESGHVSCGNLLAGLIKEKLELFGDTEDQSQIDTGMLKPIMPYEFWMPNVFPWMDDKKKKKFRYKHHESLAIKDNEWKNLNSHLLHLASTLVPIIPTDSDKEFHEQIENIFESVVESLRTDYKLFKNSKLHFTGSVYEGLKIGELDEFDYMIEIPALVDVVTFEMGLQQQFVKLVLKNSNILNDIPLASNAFTSGEMENGDHHEEHSKIKTIFTDVDSSVLDEEDTESNELLFSFVLKNLEKIIKDRIQQRLPEIWTVTQTGTINKKELALYLYSQKSAFTYILSNDNGTNVSVDVALAIPIYDLALMFKHGEVVGSKPNDFQQQVEKRKSIHHVIIRNTRTCRITFSLNEKAIMNKYRDDDPRKVCIRLLKYFRDISTIHLKTSQKEATPVMNSYHIKTLFYFLFEKYERDSDWTIETLAPRLVEAVLSLKKCFEVGTLESFFVPHYNVLRNLKSLENNTECNINDMEILQYQLESIYNVLMTANECIDGYKHILNHFDQSQSNRIRNVSAKEESERLKYSFVCTNFS